MKKEYIPPCGMNADGTYCYYNDKEPFDGTESFCISADCKVYRHCIIKRGYEHCIECNKLPCSRMEKQIKAAKKNSGQNLLANLDRLKNI